jgi:hypothetical protein
MTAKTARIKPEDVKQPQDHKQELKDVTVEFHGEQFTVKGRALKDYKLLLLLNQMEKNGAVLPQVLTRLLGDEQHDRMVAVLEEEDGYVDAESVGDFFRTLMEEAGRKNS